jgi:hypothetical protein
VKAHKASNFDGAQWRGDSTHGGSWDVTPPASPVQKVCSPETKLGWPGIASQINDQCRSWGLFPMDTFNVVWTVEVEEQSSVGHLVRECSTCRLTIT